METCLTGTVDFHGGTQTIEGEVQGRSWGDKLPHFTLFPSDLLPVWLNLARNQKVGVHPLNWYWLACMEAERRVERHGERIWKTYKDTQDTIIWWRPQSLYSSNSNLSSWITVAYLNIFTGIFTWFFPAPAWSPAPSSFTTIHLVAEAQTSLSSPNCLLLFHPIHEQVMSAPLSSTVQNLDTSHHLHCFPPSTYTHHTLLVWEQ